MTITDTATEVAPEFRADDPIVFCLVPAHNEEEQIAATIESLFAQTIPVTIIVSADNCTDRTIEIAKSYPGVIVRETFMNKAKKAGALNQAWHAYAVRADFVFTMDADTFLEPDCLEIMVNAIGTRGAVCAWPSLKPHTTKNHINRISHRLTRLDYGSFGRSVVTRKHATEVLSGIGTLFHGSVLREIAEDLNGNPWDEASIVEDYRISLECRRLGYQIAVVPGAIAHTDAIVSPMGLWKQRTRWATGTWQEILRFGWKPYTRRVWISSFMCMSILILRTIALLMVASVLFLHTPFTYNPLWIIVMAVSAIDHIDIIRSTKNTDWKDVLLSITFIPVEIYKFYREIWTLWSLGKALLKKEIAW
jgi:poly-beta-1,6-N-acetyl-D-glucosamine synthase